MVTKNGLYDDFEDTRLGNVYRLAMEGVVVKSLTVKYHMAEEYSGNGHLPSRRRLSSASCPFTIQLSRWNGR